LGGSKVGWAVSFIVLLSMVVLLVGGYVIYKYRLRVQFYRCCHHFMHYPWIIGLRILNFSEPIWCFPSVGDGSHTWILRSEQSWHNICHWIARMRFKATCRRMPNCKFWPSAPAKRLSTHVIKCPEESLKTSYTLKNIKYYRLYLWCLLPKEFWKNIQILLRFIRVWGSIVFSIWSTCRTLQQGVAGAEWRL
jgi:hypothetical protein